MQQICRNTTTPQTKAISQDSHSSHASSHAKTTLNRSLNQKKHSKTSFLTRGKALTVPTISSWASNNVVNWNQLLETSWSFNFARWSTIQSKSSLSSLKRWELLMSYSETIRSNSWENTKVRWHWTCLDKPSLKRSQMCSSQSRRETDMLTTSWSEKVRIARVLQLTGLRQTNDKVRVAVEQIRCK